MQVTQAPDRGQGPPPGADAEFAAAARKFARAKIDAGIANTEVPV